MVLQKLYDFADFILTVSLFFHPVVQLIAVNGSLALENVAIEICLCPRFDSSENKTCLVKCRALCQIAWLNLIIAMSS